MNIRIPIQKSGESSRFPVSSRDVGDQTGAPRRRTPETNKYRVETGIDRARGRAQRSRPSDTVWAGAVCSAEIFNMPHWVPLSPRTVSSDFDMDTRCSPIVRTECARSNREIANPHKKGRARATLSLDAESPTS